MKESKNSWPAGMKRTKQRESILTILESSEEPLSASDICSLMEQNGECAWLSTVYRSLELFVKNGVVIKGTILNSPMAVYQLNRFKHKHYAICMNCHRMIAMDNCPMEKFIPNLEEEDFHVMGHNVEIYGLCKDCRFKK